MKQIIFFTMRCLVVVASFTAIMIAWKTPAKVAGRYQLRSQEEIVIFDTATARLYVFDGRKFKTINPLEETNSLTTFGWHEATNFEEKNQNQK